MEWTGVRDWTGRGCEVGGSGKGWTNRTRLKGLSREREGGISWPSHRACTVKVGHNLEE